jgi:RNA polymerase sigma-70 factor, ECF subfamily
VSTTFNVGKMDLGVSTKSRQEECWQQTADEYGAALERLAWAYEGDPERRRDLLQEIYLALWRSFENFDARCSLRTWIYRVAHNVATSRVLRKKRNAPLLLTLEEVEAQESPQNVEELADREKARVRLVALIQRLDLVDRQLILAYLEGLDSQEMSQITGLSAANVWTKIHRIKNVLVRQFHSGGIDAT